MSLTSLQGKFLLVNESFASMLGLSKEEVMSGSIADLTFKDDIETSYNWIKKLGSGEISVIRFEKRFLHKNGNIIWADINTVLIKDYDENPLYFVTHILDISESKKIMNELTIAKEKAEESNRLKSEFLSQMSHEIRSPLNITMSFSEIIKTELTEHLSPELNRYFDGINLAGKRLIRTIDLILNASEMKNGTYKPIWTSFNLVEEVLQKLINEYSIQAEQKNIELKLQNNSASPVVYGDRYSMNQAFANLIDNAIKYTNAGKVEVIVDYDIENNLRVIVQDTGIGMSEEFMKNLFEPFVQESQGYSRSFEGNGLGLSLVKKYLDLNSAKISVESRLGVGSKFEVVMYDEKRE